MKKFMHVSVSSIAFSLLITGCASTTATKSSAGEINVIAEIYPLAFIAQEVGGAGVTVNTLARLGVEPHDLELTPGQVASLTKADMVLYISGLSPAIDSAIEQSHAQNAMDFSSFEEEVSLDGLKIGNDPHVWLDPERFGEMAAAFEARISSLDPGSSDRYSAALRGFQSRLTSLDLQFKSGLATCKRREIVTAHASFGYLAKRFNLLQIGISGLSPDTEPSPRRLHEITDRIKKYGITTIFFEPLLSPKLAQTLASDLDISTAPLDPLEGAQQGQTYFTAMERNLLALKTALECT